MYRSQTFHVKSYIHTYLQIKWRLRPCHLTSEISEDKISQPVTALSNVALTSGLVCATYITYVEI